MLEYPLGHSKKTITHFQQFLFSLYLNKFNSTLYEKIRKRQLTLQEFVNEVELILSSFKSEELLPFVLYTDALLIFLYSNYYSDLFRESQLYSVNPVNAKGKVNFTSSLDQSEGCVDLVRRFDAFERTNVYNVKIDYLLNKIDLLDNLI